MESHETRTLDQSPKVVESALKIFLFDFGRVSTQLFDFPFSDEAPKLRTRTWPAIARLESAGYRG